jgi:glycosyltransferase involved in cell wall biosynthesis
MISIIIPAHNEGSVIARGLKQVIDGAAPNEIEVIVVCNGCTDNTASVARSFGPPVKVIVTEISGKTHALNLGDQVATGSTRFYVDADVVIKYEAIQQLANRLKSGDVLAIAPKPTFELESCSWSVRSYYEIRSLLPSAQEGIGGSGVYALSEAGRKRLGEFPALIADDGYVRIHFQDNERETLASAHSTVFPPQTLKDLIVTKTRSHYGSFELEKLHPALWKNRGESNNKSLIRLFNSPSLWLKLAVYCSITIIARRRARKRLGYGTIKWDRDNTSRVAASKAVS